MIEGLLFDTGLGDYWVWMDEYLAGQGSRNFSIKLSKVKGDPRDEYDILSIPKEFL